MADEKPEEIPWEQRFSELVAPERFLEYRRLGIGRNNAAVAVGWSHAEMRKMLNDAGFAELEQIMLERRVESVEQRVWELASKENPSRWAVELALFCQAADRGWRPPAQRIDVSKTTKTEITLVHTAVAATLQVLESADPAALQPGGALDVIDAEVVEDRDVQD